MTSPSIDRQCPYCGEWTPAAIPNCQACGEVEDGRRASPPDRPMQAEDFLIPRNVSIWSMLACYIGLLACVLPFIGVLFGPLAICFAIIAFVKRSKKASYGAITSDLRAVFGVLLGIAGTLLWGWVGLMFLMKR